MRKMMTMVVVPAKNSIYVRLTRYGAIFAELWHDEYLIAGKVTLLTTEWRST